MQPKLVMESWHLYGLHRQRGFPTVMVLFSTLAPPRQILLHWGQVAAEDGVWFLSQGKQKTARTPGPLGT